jgi:hypothetical protein
MAICKYCKRDILFDDKKAVAVGTTENNQPIVLYYICGKCVEEGRK